MLRGQDLNIAEGLPFTQLKSVYSINKFSRRGSFYNLNNNSSDGTSPTKKTWDFKM